MSAPAVPAIAAAPAAATDPKASELDNENNKNEIEQVNEYEDADENFKPKSLKFWMILVAIYFSFFLVGLDRTIVAPAIPRITDHFHSIQDIGWYGSAYALTCACFNPISGRVYQLYSTKWVFLLAIAIFEVGSVVCGAASSSTVFIVGRAIAGFGSAFIFSGGTMLTLPLIPPAKRPVWTSLIGLAMGLSAVLGPIIGGLLTDRVNWRWCFYINLPIGGFTMLVVFLFVHPKPTKQENIGIVAQLKRLDPLGILVFVPSVVCLVLALQWGGSTYSWSAPRVVALLVVFAVLFAAFIAVEVLTPKTAMAPTRVVLNRSVAGGMLFMFLLSGGLMAIIYYLSIWFQAVKGDSALRAGVSTIPLIIAFVLVGILTGVFTQKFGYYGPSLLISPVLSSVGAGLLTTMTPSSGHSAWIGFQVLFGFGIGAGFQSCMLPAQYELPRADVPIGVALVFFMQQLSSSVFLAVSQNVFSSSLVSSLSGTAGLDAQTIVNTGATDLRHVVPQDQLQTVLRAYNHALTRVFLLAAILSACTLLGAVLVKWKKIPGKKDDGSAGKSAEAESASGKDEEKV